MNTCRSIEPRPQRLRGESGVVLLEFAFVAPFFFLLAMGLIEFGFLYRSNVMVANAAAGSTRVVAQSGNQDLSDFWTLEAIAAQVSSLPDETEVLRVIIFDPDALQWTNGACRSMGIPPSGHNGITDACNVYDGAILGTVLEADFDSSSDVSCEATNWDFFFCPLERDNDALGGLGEIGVWIEAEHRLLTGMFPSRSMTITERVIMQLEPKPPE